MRVCQCSSVVEHEREELGVGSSILPAGTTSEKGYIGLIAGLLTHRLCGWALKVARRVFQEGVTHLGDVAGVVLYERFDPATLYRSPME